MYFSYPPASLLFVHIPRTSGTSVTKALTIRYGDRHSPRDVRKHISGRTLCKTMPPEQWRLAYKFTIVRNPWSRMVSLWKFHQGSFEVERGNRSLKQLGFEGDHRRAIKAKILRESFAWWLLEFNKQHQWIPYRFNTGRLGLVTVPQTMWLTDDLDRIFRFEDTDDIEETLGIALPWMNASPADDYRRHYNQESREWVDRVFAPDIDRFGYDF
jgi:hypothetical protein